MAAALEEQGVSLELRRYGELLLNMDYLSQFHSEQNGSYTLMLFDDATDLVENSKKFNHLIHVARHSGLIFVLSIHGIVFTRASARAMVRCLLAEAYSFSHVQVQAVRYIIFTISMRAKSMIMRFTQMHADKNSVCLAFA